VTADLCGCVACGIELKSAAMELGAMGGLQILNVAGSGAILNVADYKFG
jgi:hypothetical protein